MKRPLFQQSYSRILAKLNSRCQKVKKKLSRHFQSEFFNFVFSSNNEPTNDQQETQPHISLESSAPLTICKCVWWLPWRLQSTIRMPLRPKTATTTTAASATTMTTTVSTRTGQKFHELMNIFLGHIFGSFPPSLVFSLFQPRYFLCSSIDHPGIRTNDFPFSSAHLHRFLSSRSNIALLRKIFRCWLDWRNHLLPRSLLNTVNVLGQLKF